jgi:crotonobetainyl-CoA:carnitine CoA-transferase CaiB-like acyl-CoA transferase
MGPFASDGQSVWFRQTQRGKRHVTLDLKRAEDAEQLWSLLADADVMVSSFRPGVVERLGFGPHEVHRRHPRIVVCTISAFGQAGPYADHPAHDLGAQALTGFLAVNDGPDGRPVVPGVAAADMATGLSALAAVTMALFERTSTGEGAVIDIAMIDALLPWCAHTAGEALLGGPAPVSSRQRSLGGSAFYDVYETADGRFVVLCGREAKFVRNLLTAFERPDLIPSGDFETAPDQTELKAFLRQRFLTRTRDEWDAWFREQDVAFAPVLDFSEAVRSDVVRSRGIVTEHGESLEIGPAIRIEPIRTAPS